MKKLLWILPVALLFVGCAGGRCHVTARTIEQPVSFTPCVLDSQGKVRQVKSEEIVGHFAISKTKWTMLYTAIPLGGKDWDISDELKARIQQVSGNSAVNVVVHTEGSNFLHWYFAALAPVIPCYVTVTVKGDIARFSNTTP